MAGQYWMRVVGYLQPPPAREVLSPSGYYRGDPSQIAPAHASLPGRPGAAPASAAVLSRDKIPAEITKDDRLIYFALGPFVVYAVGTVADDPKPYESDPSKKGVSVTTDVFIASVMKTQHLGGLSLPSGRDLRVLVQQYTYIWLRPEDGEWLVQRVHTKSGAKD